MLFFLLINVKMPTGVGILKIMRRKIFMLNSVEHEKSFITSGPVYSTATCIQNGLFILHTLLRIIVRVYRNRICIYEFFICLYPTVKTATTAKGTLKHNLGSQKAPYGERSKWRFLRNRL